jgi:hypothetical protein
MLTIILLHSVQVGGAPHEVGDIVTVDDADAYLVVRGGHARIADADDMAGNKSPRSASDVRAALDTEGIATAVPGGKRPNR